MNNAYNSPEQQMARLKAAGLNPNMIYGASAPTGTSGGAPTAPKADVPDFQNVKPMDIAGGIGSYVDIKMKEAQTENIKADTAQKRETTTGKQIANEVAEAQKFENMHKSQFDNWIKSAKLDAQLMENYFQQERLTQQELGRDIDISTKAAILAGVQIKNDWAQQGLEGSSMEAKQAMILLQNKGYSRSQIARALLIAGVSAAVLKNIIPAGILGKALGRNKLSTSKMKSKTTYSSKSKRGETRKREIYKY